MAWSNSKIFSAFITDALNGTAAFDLDSDTLKAALYDNDITPAQAAAAADTAYNAGQWAASGNEVADGTNWDAGGEPLTSPSSSSSSNVYTFDADDTSQGGATCTLADVYGCLVYDDTLTSPVADQGICYIYFGGVNSVTGGTFTINWDSSGICALTL
jgi:hypothetical protein